MTSIGGPAEADSPRGGRDRIAIQLSTLSDLVGAHPDALRLIYTGAPAADLGELGESPRGRLLCMEFGTSVFMLTRPVMHALARGILPWQGKTFDHGGNSGQNVFFGRHMLRFRAEVGPSELDGKPTLILHYGDEALHHPWPVRAIRDELRRAGDGLAIGPVFFGSDNARRLLCWFGLENQSG
jgi:hypothetical protein